MLVIRFLDTVNIMETKQLFTGFLDLGFASKKNQLTD